MDVALACLPLTRVRAGCGLTLRADNSVRGSRGHLECERRQRCAGVEGEKDARKSGNVFLKENKFILREERPTTAEARPSDPRVRRQLTGSEPRTRIVKQSCLEGTQKQKETLRERTCA
ncbi:hypothetical protein NDU88_002715 [Pleurodeles waltl]|uniref:Uncharacterized protein n=1 Tax=Pleurodeles waltl TaxID=8319 RepID=A0AAV7TLC2_PLEWA|nr:hypothetical protein NDU88_002715 [Pleurodeles waltl]